MVFREKGPHLPLYLPEGGPLVFPNPRDERGFDGLVAIGGDLAPARLLLAYRKGIFPWYADGTDILWWSPNPRAIIELDAVHCSRSLQRRMKRGDFRFTFDQAFTEVVDACADRDEGTWILPEMADAYWQLHQSGHAHSFEAWQGESLVGGLYGVHVNGLFAAESMFHRQTDASKAVLVASVRALAGCGIRLFDVQFKTSHLESMGATEISRDAYLLRLEAALSAQVSLENLR